MSNNMLSMTVLVSVLIFAVCTGALVAVVLYIRSKVRDFSRSAFGTDSLKEGFAQVEAEYASTPKSVSALTGLYLPKIQKDFPDFSYDEMKTKSNNVLTSYLLALDSHQADRLTEGNEDLKNKLENQLVQLDNVGCRMHFQNIRIHRTEITAYQKNKGRVIITFQSSIEYIYFKQDETGKVIEGNQAMKKQSRYDVDLVYIQDRNIASQDMDGTIGLNCPNCGAPLTGLGEDTCPYCQTPVIKLNIHAWSFGDIREK